MVIIIAKNKTGLILYKRGSLKRNSSVAYMYILIYFNFVCKSNFKNTFHDKIIKRHIAQCQ